MKNRHTLLFGIVKKMTALLIVLFILFPMLPNIDFGDSPMTLKASAASVASGNGTWISGKLTYTWEATSNGTTGNGATGSVSVSGNTITVTATNSKEVSGCSTTAAEATTNTVTVTNASSYPIKITTLTPNSKASVSGVKLDDTIASGATFKVTVTAPAVSSSTKVTGTVAIAVEEQTSVTITLAASPYVSYTVNNTAVAQNGSDQTFTTNAGTSISLPSITAPSGYTFKGWRIGSTMTTASSFTADAGYTVFPVIVSSGVDITSANFMVGTTTYTFWEDAVTAAVSGDGKMFVNLENITLPDNVPDNLLPASGGTYVKPVTGGGVEYILPAGVTLVLPYSTSTTVHTTTPAYGYKARVTPSPFRTMTVPNGAKITVDGSVSVDSYVCAYGQSNQGNGTPSGPHGKIVMKSGSEMTLNSGANLYCYGYINGDGNIYVKSGAKVYELFQFCDWRGGNGTNNINGNSQRVFPMSQYYVQNVEAPMTLYKGATEYVWSAVNMSSSAYATNQIEFIGTNGMFKLTGGSSDYITKRYHANVDRLEIAAHGDMSLNNLTVKVSGLPLIGTITMNSNEYVLPLNNMNIVVETGTTSIASGQTYGVAFLPSSKLTVNEGAAFNANAPVYLYDSDDWGGYCGASNLKLVVSGYSTANGATTIRTADNLKDAEIDVNGTVNVSSKLYTTPHGACITSSAGTGVINFTTACATGTPTTYQATQSGTDISYVSITVNNAWLQNGDGSYSQTVSTGSSTWCYDKPGEHWYRYLVDFNYNNTLIARDYYCENNDTVTYDASWLTNLGATASNGTATVSGTNVNVTDVTEDSTVTLTGTPAEYIPTFVLNAKQYSIYQLYTGNTISDTTTINGETFYVVDQGSSALAVGTTYAAPTDASMGVRAANHNSITWNMSGLSATSGDPYRGTVPAGETAQGPTYIYGFYTGVVAHNSWNDQYYDTLIGAFAVLPQDVSATITLLADCGTFEEESGTVTYTAYPSNNITLDLNGHKAVGRIASSGTFTLELNGGTLDCHTGSTVQSANYKGMATVINSGTMIIQDSKGGGMVTTDATSSSSGTDGTAVIRNNKGATLTVTGKDSDHLLTIKENQTEVAYNSSYGYYAYNYGIYNLGTITALTNVDITTAHSRTTGVNLYNYDTGVVTLISGGHMYCYSGSSIFNYGGTITTIDGLKIDGKNGITNRNIRSGSQAAGWSVTDVNTGTIETIQNCTIEVGQYAIYNHAKITTMKDSVFTAQPDSAQVDTRGDGLSVALDGNIQCYTVYNSYEWWYNTNVWKQVDSSSAPYTRVNYYMEEEQYRPTIGTITNCRIYAKNTTASASYGQYALVNYGVINTIGGTTTIKAMKHADNSKSVSCYYAMHNLGGGIIKSIEGTVNISAAGIGTVYNDGAFTTQINYTYANKVAGNITNQKNTYGEPSTINSITCSGTWSCGSGSSYYYALMNSGYIGTINSTGLTLEGGYNVLYNATGSANTTYEITKKYTDGATASTEYERDTHYVKNLEKGSTIAIINGITINVKGTKVYQGLNNQGHIGTLSNVTVGFADGATNNTSSYPLVLNGDSRYQSYTETILTNRTAETDPHLTVTAGVVTRYDRDYTYTLPPTIDTIDNLTVTSIGTYAFRNAGHIGTLKNSTITGTQYSLQNYANGPYTERQTRQYYSGASIFKTDKNAGELNKHYKRNAATIDLIDNCTITTPANTYAMFNSGHVGTIKNSTLQAGTTTAKASALANMNSQEREYTRDLESILYVTANTTSACTAYYGSGGESDVVTYDYDVPVIDLIGEGNTLKATSTVINNTGIILEINSGSGTLTTITGSTAKGSSIYNYSCVLDTRTTTTPYTAATAASTSGTKGTAVNTDTNQPGAQIGTIKNVFINANGNGIINGDATSGKTPTIGEIGEGTEIYAHCTTADYTAVINKDYAKITEISGGLFKATKATTYAYKNLNTREGCATLISGGYFQGASNTRANAILEPDNTSRQTYPSGKKLSSSTLDPTEVNANMSGTYYYLANTYTVTFDAQGHGTAPADQTIESGLKATEPTAPTATGYRFDGWYKESGCTNPWNFSTDTVTENTTLYAKWTAYYTVTFDLQDHGDEIEPLTGITSGSKITAPTAPTASGYRFAGWFKESGCSNEWDFVSDTVTSDVTLYAKWTQLFAVSFDMNGHGTSTPSTQTVEDGQKATKPAAPAVNSEITENGVKYRFDGWYTDNTFGTAFDFNTAIKSNTTVYAKWTAFYTVTFDMQGHGGAISPITDLTTGSKITAPTAPTASGYRFDGWYKESGCTNAWNFSTDTVTENTTLYAKWTALYTVTFDMNGHGIQIDPIDNLASGSTISAPDEPSEDEMIFEGWYKEAACTNAWNFDSDTVTADTTLYAKWTKIFNQHSLTAAGDVGVNYYLVLPEEMKQEIEENPDNNVHIDFSWGSNVENEGKPYTFTDDELAAKDGYYVATVPVSAKEMNDEITATLYDGNNVIASQNYRATDYLYEVINTPTAELAAKINKTYDQVKALKNLCRSMVNYGAQSQIQFGYHTESLANAALADYSTDDPDYDPSVNYVEQTVESSDLSQYSVSADTVYKAVTSMPGYAGLSLTLKSETQMNVIVTNSSRNPVATGLADGVTADPYTVTQSNMNGRNTSGSVVENAYISYNIINIPAARLKADITINYFGSEYTVNPASYMYSALKAAENNASNASYEKLANVIKALYNYNYRAVAYFG